MNYFVSQNQFYNAVFEKMNICFFTYDIINRTVYVPQKARELFQWKDFYVNMPVSFADDFVADEYRESFFQLYEDCHNGEENCECIFEDKNHRFFLCVKLQIMQRDRKGNPLTAIGIVHNQMEVKRLLQKQKRYTTAILSDCLGYIEVNLSRNMIVDSVIDSKAKESFFASADQIFSQMKTGYDEFEHWWSENVLASDKKEFLEVSNCKYLISCFEKGTHLVEIFCKSITSKGNAADNKQTYYLSEDEATGDIIAMCVVHDLTKQREEERLTHHRKLVIQKLCDKFDAICYVNLDENTMVYYHVTRVFNFRKAKKGEHFKYLEHVEQFAESFVLEEDREKFLKYMSPEVIRSRLKEKSICIFDCRMTEGEEVHYFSVRMVRDDSDKTNFSVVIGFRNIDSAIKQHKLLEETMRYAEHASKAKTNFLANMSHDMRTPMNAIVGFTSLAAANLDDKVKLKGYLEKIASSGNHLLSLINDVLDMSRIESGKVVLSESEENLSEILRDLKVLIQPQIDAKQMDFFIDICDVRDELIYCDELRLKQVLLNIFTNAVKYTQPGGTVSVRIIQKEKHQRDCGNYEFHIKDNGRGMSKEFLEHIFEPFTRENPNNSDVNSGTGLGLSIVKSIIDMMNGKIEVKSELGKGTEFVISLTFKLQKVKHVEVISNSKNVEASSCSLEQPHAAKEKSVPMDFTGKKVLLVEDIEINQEIANEILTEKGFQVFIADNGKIALDMVKQAKQGDYDIILMDIRMPEMDGYEATKAIRQMDSPYKNIPIVALTANAFEDDRQMSFRVGMNEHVSKPLDEERLFTVLCDLLD